MAISSDNAGIIAALAEKTAYLQTELLADAVLLNEELTADLEKEVDIADSKVKLAVVKA